MYKRQTLALCIRSEYCHKLFFGVTLTELRRMAYEYAERNNIKHNFNKATKLVGKDWAQAFIKINPQVSLRKPSSTE